MKKNIVALMIGLTMVFAMAGCGAAETEATAPAVESTVSVETETAETAPVETETVEPTETTPVETEAVEPTETEVVEPTETVPAETEVLEPTETAPVETEVAEVPSEPEFTVTEISGTKYATKSVNVRKGPSTDYDKVGVLALNEEIAITGQADNGWFEFDMDGEKVYVSDKYVSDNKTEIKQVAKNDASEQKPVESVREDYGSGMPGLIFAEEDPEYDYNGYDPNANAEAARIKRCGWEPGNSYSEYICNISGGTTPTCELRTYHVLSYEDYEVTVEPATYEDYLAAGGTPLE